MEGVEIRNFATKNWKLYTNFHVKKKYLKIPLGNLYNIVGTCSMSIPAEKMVAHSCPFKTYEENKADHPGIYFSELAFTL